MRALRPKIKSENPLQIGGFRTNCGGEGADMSLEASFPEICPWQDEYDPDCPTELLVDGNEVDEYEFDHAVIQKWLPWVTIG